MLFAESYVVACKHRILQSVGLVSSLLVNKFYPFQGERKSPKVLGAGSFFSSTSSVKYIDASDIDTELIIANNMIVYENFLSLEDENSLLREIEPYLKRLRYEYDHWDNAIHGYRETEKLKWNEQNTLIIQKVRNLAFPPGTLQLAHVHVLDIAKNGYIKPHVDAVRFCGDTIAGLCLLSSCVMRLARESNKKNFADILLNQRSLYVMKHAVRYEFTHEVLPEETSQFQGRKVPRDRRISVICRNEPRKEDCES